EEELTGGAVGPAPQADVIEEVPDGQHGGMNNGVGDALGASLAASPRPLVAVPDEERLDVAAFELAERADVGAVRAEELTEGHQIVDQAVDGLGGQHRRPGFHVSGQRFSDRRTWNGHEAFGDRRAPPAAGRRGVDDVELVEELTSAVEAGQVGPAAPVTDRRRSSQASSEVVEHPTVDRSQ